MKLKLLLLLLFLCTFIIPAKLGKHEKHNGHGKKDTKEKPEEKHGHKAGKHHKRVEELLKDYDDQDDSHDDEDEERGEWLFELQDVKGNCKPNPCLNKGLCEEKHGKFKCRCPKPYKGRRCEKVTPVCKRNTCGYGQCVLTSTPPHYECKCTAPFKPPHCKLIAPCEANICLNGGTCVKDGQDFDCVCKAGFTGKFCHVGPDDCYEGNGESYRGKVSETDDGDDCLFWNSHFILGQGINPFTTYEDAHGLGRHNFCRNPDGEKKPWCFTKSGKKLRWDYCDVKKCATTNVTRPTSGSHVPEALKPCPTPASHVPASLTPESHVPADLTPESNVPASPTPESHVPVSPTPESHVPVSPTPESHVPLIPTPASHVPLIPTPASHVPAPPKPGSHAPAVVTMDSQFATCGKPQPTKVMHRIYGGLKTLPGAQPWQASVQVRPTGTGLSFKHICGGILIKSCWVLTAGHCIDKTKDYQVVLGGTDLLKYEESEQVLEVVEPILHEQYKETRDSVYNDIALLRLKAKNGKCAEESQFVKTACLPRETFPDGTECSISGWGATPQSQHGSNQLLDADVLLISHNVCSSDKVYGKLIDNTMFCAGHLEGGVDSCQGDSGGPLTCVRDQAHYVYGIVSWGDSCGEKNKPGVYTQVTHFLDWINAKTSSKAP
ncbi:hyaluronan-binding protein 2-like [Trichomycterus rosablanca]|uniref:hyaluronan-binding protein 2-like n=1 Tax=Trichomycterus rosablanca TaxID=2290929 RepID=UPI002F357031